MSLSSLIHHLQARPPTLNLYSLRRPPLKACVCRADRNSGVRGCGRGCAAREPLCHRWLRRVRLVGRRTSPVGLYAVFKAGALERVHIDRYTKTLLYRFCACAVIRVGVGQKKRFEKRDGLWFWRRCSSASRLPSSSLPASTNTPTPRLTMR